ncbi:response regulator [Clostridium sporogenes]|uniref:Stage 0 sporulation protein A homolog n=1 Tax=Clostridium botulinum TaxID=1491 RepID=A0A6M0T224_CLOBO|nr:response regulator [Clostridium sporogenes]NFA60211.1 response regulator [Clostridium botulinum]NFI72814.1 response regulator [Clostridium sporogenes]NFL72399.1 response regulator [Clostridium sporogenes]NFM23412.1 response regulator [Clostridium sporogenes]NFP60227.1 response regulator [Clostridium sporogenes]
MYKILLADDEWLEREVLKIILGNIEENIEIVGEASNGKEAVELTDKLDPDIIFMDTRMPAMDGITAAEIIKSKDEYKKIVMLIDYGEYDFIHKALTNGDIAYLSKPIKDLELLNCIQIQINNIKNGKNKFGKLNKVLYPALEYIEANYSEEITLEKAASISNLSIYYFSKLFKKEMGMTFISYVTKYKIEKAEELLENTDIPIVNIASQLGYYECGYFTKVFKKIKGITPSEYRNKIKKNHSIFK